MSKRSSKYLDRLENLLRKTSRDFAKPMRARNLNDKQLLTHHEDNFDLFANEVFESPERFSPRRLGVLLGAFCAMPELCMTEEDQPRLKALRNNIELCMSEIVQMTASVPEPLQANMRQLNMAQHQLCTFQMVIMKIAERLGVEVSEDLENWEAGLRHQPKSIRKSWKNLCKRLESPLIELS